MAKKKKTRQQKVISDLRRQLSKEDLSSQRLQVETLNVLQEKTPKKESPKDISITKEETLNYSYLINDLKKTAFLTTSIIALQIVLFLALTNKILILPGLSY